MDNKKVLVTGGAGFIGSHLVKLLVKKGMDVVVLDALTYAGDLKNLEDVTQSGQVEFIHGNICDYSLVRDLFLNKKFQTVFHLAAESHVDRSIEKPSTFIETNIVGSYQLLSCALESYQKLSLEDQKKFKFIQISTDEVFGSLGEMGYFTELSPYQPNSPYSASKASADLLARAWFKTYHFPVIITHCSNNYGPYQYSEKLIPTMIHSALSGLPLPIYGDGKNMRDWIHVEDHVLGIWLAYEKGKIGEAYCLGGRTEKTNLELVETICKILDQLRPKKQGGSYLEQISFIKDRLGHDYRYAIDDIKAEKELGFERTILNFEKGLRQTIEWYLSNDN